MGIYVLIVSAARESSVFAMCVGLGLYLTTDKYYISCPPVREARPTATTTYIIYIHIQPHFMYIESIFYNSKLSLWAAKANGVLFCMFALDQRQLCDVFLISLYIYRT